MSNEERKIEFEAYKGTNNKRVVNITKQTHIRREFSPGSPGKPNAFNEGPIELRSWSTPTSGSSEIVYVNGYETTTSEALLVMESSTYSDFKAAVEAYNEYYSSDDEGEQRGSCPEPMEVVGDE